MTDLPEDTNEVEGVSDTPDAVTEVEETSPQPDVTVNAERIDVDPVGTSTDTAVDDNTSYPAPDVEEELTPEVPYAGEFKPNPNIELPLPILEEGKFDKLGAVYLSNLEYTEALAIHRYLHAVVYNEQKTRRAQVSAQKGEHSFVVSEVNNNIYYLTESERDQIAVVSQYLDTVRKAGGEGLFEGEDEGWTNKPTLGDQVIAIGTIDNSNSKDPVARIRQQLRMTTGKGIPLWSAGFHMYIEGPGLLDQLHLETKLLAEKSDMGRDSNGYVYSAGAVYMNCHVIDFILAHVSSTSIGITDPQALMELIPLTELEPMALAMAATIYPDGYNLERPCLTTQGGCGAVLSRKVNLRRMLLVRRKRLTDNQFALMAKKSAHIDRELVINYQKSLRPDVSRLVHVKDDIYLKLWVPSLADYRRIASTWVETLDNRARQLIASKSNEAERQNYLGRANNIALLLAFSHWVEGVVTKDPEKLDDEPTVILSRTAIDKNDPNSRHRVETDLGSILEDISGDNDVVNEVIAGIEKFITAMTFSTPIVPKTTCPGCNLPSTGDELSDHPHVVNINPIELFFTLLHHKLQQAGG